LLIQLGIPYDSWDALRTAEELMSFIHQQATAASVELAKERGPFPNLAGSVFDRNGTPRPRNATITTIAPTGTLATIAGCSSGIEPIFAVCSERHILDSRLIEVNTQFERIAKERGFYSEALVEEILAKGSVHHVEGVPDDVKRLFVTAHDIAPEWHVRLQAAFQRYTDNAVSKTINFAQTATRDDIRRAYLLGYEQGCKGLTVYRDGSRETQVLVTGTGKSTGGPGRVDRRPRPDIVYGMTRKMSTGCGSLYITINEDENGQPFEIFAQIGKAGGCASSQTESTARLCSALLRLGAEPDLIVKQLRGISCHLPTFVNGTKVHSCADAIAQVLEDYLSTKKPATTPKVDMPFGNLPTNGGKAVAMTRGACSNCGSSALEHSEGCVVCRLCGFSECG
jgi:ribonucleoside-diphosphate reductase alpha chain